MNRQSYILVLSIIIALVISLSIVTARENNPATTPDQPAVEAHLAKIWSAKTDFWRYQQALHRLYRLAKHEQAVWSAKVDYWDSQAEQDQLATYFAHQGKIWNAKVSAWR